MVLAFTVAGAAPDFPSDSMSGHRIKGAPDFPFNCRRSQH